MKKIFLVLYLFISCVFLSCSSETSSDDIINDFHPVDSLIYGEWVIKEGNVTGFIAQGNFSHSFEFKANGNFKEKVYYGCASSELFTTFNSKDCIGNWKGNDNIITLNDWDGVFLEDKIYVLSVTEDELNLSFKGNTLKYIRKEHEFSNLKSEIVGYWKYLTTLDKKGYYHFKKDGTGRYETYFSDDSYITGFADIDKWWVEGHQIVVHKARTAAGWYKYFDISFINDTYMGINDIVVIAK